MNDNKTLYTIGLFTLLFIMLIVLWTIVVTNEKALMLNAIAIDKANKRIHLLESRVKDLENRWDAKFLRMVDQATFYKGNEVEVWKLIQRKEK